MKKGYAYFSFLLFLVVHGKYKFPDKEFAIIPIMEGEYYEDVNCSKQLKYTRETYYEGTACEFVKSHFFIRKELKNRRILSRVTLYYLHGAIFCKFRGTAIF